MTLHCDFEYACLSVLNYTYVLLNSIKEINRLISKGFTSKLLLRKADVLKTTNFDV